MTTIDNGAPRPVCACRRIAVSSMSQAEAVPTAGCQNAGRRGKRRARGAAAWALPSVALALVPKCPMCIAAYLAIGGGLGVSISTAAHLRVALVWLCWSALAVLAVRAVIRVRSGKYSVPGVHQLLSGARREAPRSSARIAAA